MPVVALIDGIKIWFYNDDHPPPHFHAAYAEHDALIDVETLEIIAGLVAPSSVPEGRCMGAIAKGGTRSRVGDRTIRSQPRKNPVRLLPRVTSVEYVIQGVLKIVWDDAFEGVVDLRPVIDRGRIFTYLQNPENFRKFSVAEFGHSVGWVTDSGAEIDFDSHSLRLKSENQAKLQLLVANLNH